MALAAWADAILIAPCTANTLSSVAHGRCDNLLTATVTCAELPVVLVPNMNSRMWSNPAVHRCVETVRSDGHIVVDMEDSLAYEFGTRETHLDLAMAGPEVVVDHVRRAVTSRRVSAS
ncbi:flavoprotein [Nocardioides panaciterrulae]|uniref:Phosphopantothenoylcysteine synthetase/decarboxylase n=1 Tax=Nocardioides panaciterrulae TaxID=661492 RepID=A0A7Y9JAV3_9ACTN|nr:phosphopantothenoylcysteine synthetase/decarboxylase [Nocardioides panaciterrulae]